MKIATWKSLKEDYSKKEINDAFYGGLAFASLLFFPIIIALVEVLSVLIFRLTLFVILIIIALLLYVLTIHFFWRKSLLLKKSDIKTDIRKLFLMNSLYINIAVLIFGVIIAVFVLPLFFI